MPPGPESVLQRVYAHEFTTVYTTDATGSAAREEAQRVFDERWSGRLREGDYAMDEMPGGSVTILVQTWNLVSEWHGEVPAGEARTGRRIVAAGSPDERSLLDYGKKLLPA